MKKIKKTPFLILFAFSLSFVNAQKSEESVMLEKINLKHIEFVENEHGNKEDKETKVLRIIRNEYFKSETLKEAKEIALFYLQKKQDM